MTNAQALAKLRRLFGKKAHYSVNPKARDADRRAEIKATLPGLRDVREAARKAAADKRLALLSDPEYQRLHKAAEAATEAFNTASYWASTLRVEAGTSDGFFFHVKAKGDTWNEVFDELERKAVKP